MWEVDFVTSQAHIERVEFITSSARNDRSDSVSILARYVAVDFITSSARRCVSEFTVYTTHIDVMGSDPISTRASLTVSTANMAHAVLSDSSK